MQRPFARGMLGCAKEGFSTMRNVTLLNDGWTFRDGFEPAFAKAPITGAAVSLPHTAVELPLSYFDETVYQRPFTYQRVIASDPTFEGRMVSVVFDGAMANAVVYLNGEIIAAHPDGYTPIEAPLSDRLRPGDNVLTVAIDGAENPAIPPFGGQIDYLTYAGLYRDAWLKVTAPISIGGLKVETANTLSAEKDVTVRCELANPLALPLSGQFSVAIVDAAGRVVAEAGVALTGPSATVTFAGLKGLKLWDIDDPVLYTAKATLETPVGRDDQSATFGFRTARFTATGFELNGRPLKIRGLNRHQSWAYSGYAMGRAAQELDAEILKRKLKVNLVRSSHYPPSPWFLDHCDRIGLLVFEEIPGWQHIGDLAWQDESVRNVERMIRRDWNHPSIILWGVRINESPDNHDFYVRTNAKARELDPTRQTGGVRYITDSEFLEDVFTQNDFILGDFEQPGSNRPRTALRRQQECTGLPHAVPYMVTEYNGHMYPTKRVDQEQRQAEHVRRHLDVLNAAAGDPAIGGTIGWCMADYNTHKDFGSGDRICHHGVMDIFREPKFAAYAYASQCDPADEVILKPVTYWARGERNIGGVLPLIVLTNCDAVELRYGTLAKRVGPDRETYPHLPRAPVIFDHRHFTAAELGLWGHNWLDGTIVGFIDGREVARVEFTAAPVPTRLEVAPDRTALTAAGRDSVRVVVRPLDQKGNILPFLDDAIDIGVDGPARLIGPSRITFKGGAAGFWLETTGHAGAISLGVMSPRFAPVTCELQAL